MQTDIIYLDRIQYISVKTKNLNYKHSIVFLKLEVKSFRLYNVRFAVAFDNGTYAVLGATFVREGDCGENEEGQMFRWWQSV